MLLHLNKKDRLNLIFLYKQAQISFYRILSFLIGQSDRTLGQQNNGKQNNIEDGYFRL